MSSLDRSTNLYDPELLDRLVDGELGEAERRELLLRLDQHPDGWRRCAMAFLEAQCWKQEMGQIVRPMTERPAGVPEAVRPQIAPTPKARTTRHWSLANVLAMAACFLAAFFLGTRLPMGHLGTNNPLPIDSLAHDGSVPGRNPGGIAPAGTLPASTVAVPAPQANSDADPWELVTLTARGGSGETSQTIRVPAIRRDQFDRKSIDELPAGIPPEMLRALERTGHEVVQQRELVPVDLPGGRRLVLPVDRVEIHQVSQ